MNSSCISIFTIKDITNFLKSYEHKIFISPYSSTTSSLQLHFIQSKKKKKKNQLKNLKCVLISAEGMADSLKTVASVFSDKRVLLINSVPFLSIFSFAYTFQCLSANLVTFTS